MDNKTIRLILPQWQGGNRYVYAFGAKLLEWLAPAANCETLEIPLIPKTPEVIKDGIAFKEELLRHSGEIYRFLQSKSPDKIIVFGGDCSISLAPFPYLLGKNPSLTFWKNTKAMLQSSGWTGMEIFPSPEKQQIIMLWYWLLFWVKGIQIFRIL